jgi:serine/threonine-protein kinase
MGLAYDYVKVLDFGLVKPTGEGGSVVASMDTAVTGTPAYMAPEMVTGDAEVDRRADIYAIGCVAYWMLSGCLVFDESSPMKMAVAHASYPPVPPSKRTDETIAPSVDSVILRCLEKDPADRYQTVRELSVELAACDVGPAWTDEQAESWWRQCKPAESMAG